MSIQKVLFLALNITLLSACSTTETKSTASNEKKLEIKDEEIEKEFENIKNSDFIRPEEVSFDPLIDTYSKEKKSNLTPISKETLDRDGESLDDFLDSESELTKGTALCYQKRIEDGLQVLDGIYRKYQKNPSFWNQMGTCYYLKDEKRKALLYYNRARDLSDKYAPAVNNVGVLLYKEGKYQKALEAFKKAREILPFSKTPTYNLAHLYLRFGLVSDAMPLFQGLHADHPSDKDISNGLATALLISGQLEESLSLWESLDSITQSWPWVGINYAYALFLNNQVEQAKSVFLQIRNNDLGTLEGHYKNVGKQIGAK